MLIDANYEILSIRSTSFLLPLVDVQALIAGEPTEYGSKRFSRLKERPLVVKR